MKTLLVALNAQYMHVNLALRQIICSLEGETDIGEVSLYEAHINLPFRQILEEIGRRQPDAVGFSVYIWNAGLVWRLCRALRQALPDVCLFAGGPEVEYVAQRVLTEHPELDYVLSGEGEGNMGPFLRSLSAGQDPVPEIVVDPADTVETTENMETAENVETAETVETKGTVSVNSCGRIQEIQLRQQMQQTQQIQKTQKRHTASVPGVSCLRNGVFIQTQVQEFSDPEQWPDVWAGDRLRGLEDRILYVETSRGCPFRCAYCLSSRTGRVRALNADESIRRLTYMAEQGAKLIKLVDRTFNFDPHRAAVIWRGLIEHSNRTGLHPRYHFEIGAHLLDEEAFAVLQDAPYGLFQFEAGIQTTNAGVLSDLGRRIPFEILEKPLRRVQSLGTIPLHTDLIAGLPGEDMKSFTQTFDKTFSIGAGQLQLGFLKVLPGSPMEDRVEQTNLRYEPDPPYEVVSTPEMSFADLCHLKDVETVLDWYHNTGRYSAAIRYLLSQEYTDPCTATGEDFQCLNTQCLNTQCLQTQCLLTQSPQTQHPETQEEKEQEQKKQEHKERKEQEQKKQEHKEQKEQETQMYFSNVPRAYDLFSHMAQTLRNAGMLGMQHREKQKAAMLLSVFCPDGKGPLPELVAHGLLKCGLGREVPEAADQQEDDELRFLLRQRYHPVRGQRARRYHWDVEAYEKGEELVRKDTIVFYEGQS